MLLELVIGWCVLVMIAGAPVLRRDMRAKRYRRCLRNIRALEIELGIRPAPPTFLEALQQAEIRPEWYQLAWGQHRAALTPKDAAQRWSEAAGAKAENYATGLRMGEMQIREAERRGLLKVVP